MSDDADKEEIKHSKVISEPATIIWPWTPDNDTEQFTVNDIKRKLDEHQAREAEALARGEEPLRIVDHIGLLHKHGRLSLSPDEMTKLKEMGLNLSLLTNPEVTASRTARALLADTAALKTRSEAMSAWWYEKVARPTLSRMLIERRKDLQTRMLVALRFHAKTKQEQQKAQQREYLKLANIDDSFLDAATGASVVKLTRETYDDILRMHRSTDDLRVRAMCAHVLDCDDARRYNAEDLLQTMGIEASVTDYFTADNSVLCNIKPKSAVDAVQLQSLPLTCAAGNYTFAISKPRQSDIKFTMEIDYSKMRIEPNVVGGEIVSYDACDPGTIVVDSCPGYMRDTARISCNPVADAVGYDFKLFPHSANSGGGQSRVVSLKTAPNLQTIKRSQMKAYEKLFKLSNVLPPNPEFEMREIDHSSIVWQTTETTGLAMPSKSTDSRKYRGPEHDARRKAKKLKRKAQKQQRK